MQTKSLLTFLFSLSCLFVLQAQVPEYQNFKLVKQINATPVKDQFYTSTCWSYAGVSFIESEYYRHTREPLDLSEMFFARYSYLNKINAYLHHKGQIYFTPGGQFHDILQVISDHGMMPETSFILPDGSGLLMDHRHLDTLMVIFTKHLLEQGRTELTDADLSLISRILDWRMGTSPASFQYEGNTYTSRSFSKDVIGFNPEDYIEITSYTHHPFYSPFVLEDKFNWMKRAYMNVPLADLIEIAHYALDHGMTICWDGDVTETTFDYYKGAAYLNPGISSDQKNRQVTFEEQTTTIDHMMHITGYAKDKKNSTWYYVKNSWGDANPYKGYMYMSEEYFKLKTVAIIVHKDAIPQKIKDKMKF